MIDERKYPFFSYLNDGMSRSERLLLNVVHSLIENALDFLESSKAYEYACAYGPVAFAEQFKTIRVAARRQMGHSSVIKRLAYDRHYRYLQPSLILVSHRNRVDNYDRKLAFDFCHGNEKITSYNNLAVASTAFEPGRGILPLRERVQDRIRVCYVDDTVNFPEKYIDQMYTYLSDRVDLFVLL